MKDLERRKLRQERNSAVGDGSLNRPLQIQFFQAVGLWLYCRIHAVDENHRDQFGALLGELDWGSRSKSHSQGTLWRS